LPDPVHTTKAYKNEVLKLRKLTFFTGDKYDKSTGLPERLNTSTE